MERNTEACVMTTMLYSFCMDRKPSCHRQGGLIYALVWLRVFSDVAPATLLRWLNITPLANTQYDLIYLPDFSWRAEVVFVLLLCHKYTCNPFYQFSYLPMIMSLASCIIWKTNKYFRSLHYGKENHILEINHGVGLALYIYIYMFDILQILFLHLIFLRTSRGL